MTETSNGKAQLLIPFELVLGSHNVDHGTMCIRFNYYITRLVATNESIQFPFHNKNFSKA